LASSLDHQFLGSLGVRHEPPRRRAAGNRDERAALQMIELHSMPTS
jgi:hypothetical protein